MVWTKLIIVVEINRVPDYLLSWVRDPSRRRFWNRLWMCRGGCPGFPGGINGLKEEAYCWFATAKESWSQLGTSYRNWDISLLLMTETIATARKIVSSQLGKRIREQRQHWSVGEGVRQICNPKCSHMGRSTSSSEPGGCSGKKHRGT